MNKEHTFKDERLDSIDRHGLYALVISARGGYYFACDETKSELEGTTCWERVPYESGREIMEALARAEDEGSPVDQDSVDKFIHACCHPDELEVYRRAEKAAVREDGSRSAVLEGKDGEALKASLRRDIDGARKAAASLAGKNRQGRPRTAPPPPRAREVR
jgi:hypothetical protein